MKSFVLLTFLAAVLVSCDPGADRINVIDKEIRELRVQLNQRKANELKLLKDLNSVMVEYQAVYDSDSLLSEDAKAAKLQTIGEKMRSLEMTRQKSQIETTKNQTKIIRLQLEKDELKRKR